ncbi:hypothetical protein U1Q18_037619, partial [Sarracenia purpurea var. burkii]
WRYDLQVLTGPDVVSCLGRRRTELTIWPGDRGGSLKRGTRDWNPDQTLPGAVESYMS